MHIFSAGREVNKNLPKEAFFRNLEVAPSVKAKFTSDVQKITLVCCLSPQTSTLPAGEEVKEVDVMRLDLKNPDIDSKILETIARQMPFKLIFELVYNDREQIAVWHRKLYKTDSRLIDAAALEIKGLNLDEVWKNLVAQIAGLKVAPEQSLDEAAANKEEVEKLKKQIAALENKIHREPQFNRQVEMNKELKSLKMSLGEHN